VKRRQLLLAALWLGLSHPALAESVFTVRPDDPSAVYLTRQDFGAQGDGTSDDSAAVQAAIDKAGASPGGGIVFVPSGRYRLTRTIYVWRSVRVIGYGTTRPVLVLADYTPGFQTGIGLMVLFSAGGPAAAASGGRGGRGRVPFPPPGTVPPNENVPDANQGTFYSAMMNVDVEIGAGNPAAVGIRFHVAQHGVLTHMDFHTGSGLAALTEIGNVAHDLRFYGGRYGILTTNTSPFWPFTLADSVFEGQRDAAIREHMAGLTLIRDTFRNVPVAVEIDPEFSDQLWVKDNRFENISRAVVMISNEKNPMTEVGFENAICANVPVFAKFRESSKTQPGAGAIYRVANFNYGLIVPAAGMTGHIDAHYSAEPLKAMPASMAAAIRRLPPAESWINVQTLGVKGDGKTDDTDAIRKAIDAHPVLYFPAGYYIVRDTIALKKETVLIALHPGTTQLDLPDSTPAYQGAGAPKGLLEAPQGGTNIVAGLGVFTGGVNPRATGIVWMAGEDSLMDDVHIHGFAGTFLPANVRTAFYNPGRGGGFALPGRLGAQYASVWVTRGGGGTFNGVWTPNTFARTGFYVSDTTTPGHVYELSAEHHLSSEIRLDRVENWDFYGPQTEEEVSTSAEAVSLEVTASKNITFANYHAYRVARSYAPAAAAARTFRSSGIRFRNVHVNAEHGYATCDEAGCGTFLRAGKFAYENAVEDVTHHLQVREREFAVLDIQPSPPRAARAGVSTMTAPGARVEELESGFHSISGGAVDAHGTIFFVDHYQQRIYSWSRADGLTIVGDDPIDAVNLAVDRSGHLLVMSSAGAEGSVYSVRPEGPHDELTAIAAQPRAPHSDAAVVVPGNVWVDGQFSNYLDLNTYQYTTLAQMFAREMTTPTEKEYVSPDGSLVLPARRALRQGPDGSYPGMDESGWRWSHNLDAYNFVTALPGHRLYISSGAENRTYSATTQPDGTLRDLKPFAERGAESVAVDAQGNVYIANGQIFVYDSTGKAIDEIDVPERPIGLLFGGPDRRTLFILTHRALYGVKTREAGVTLPWVQ
jgi:sugar lactone lactonase YvrE